MERIIIHADGSSIRRAKLHGRDHFVAPLTMIVPGVLEGSRGPLLYSADEVGRDVDAWNHMPIVVHHPQRDGEHVSARDPDILNESAIGVVLRSRFDDKLTGEAWIDVERAKIVDPRVYNLLRARRPIEVSTGLFLEAELVPNGTTTESGKAYTHIARNFKPDHLAILPDTPGACSVADGCGIFVNSDGTRMKSIVNQPSHNDLYQQLSSLIRTKQTNEMVYVVDVFDKFVVFEDNGKLFRIGYQTDLRSDGKISLSGEAVPVRRVTHYKPIANESSDDEDSSTANVLSTLAYDPIGNKRDTKVGRCYDTLKSTMGKQSAARICQSSTGTSLKTGKKPKSKLV